MFESMKARDDFSYAFEKIRNAIVSPDSDSVYAATHLGLKTLSRKYDQFRQELSDAGQLHGHEYELDTYEHALSVLQCYFMGNAGGLNEQDAQIFSFYLQAEHRRFAALASELAMNHS